MTKSATKATLKNSIEIALQLSDSEVNFKNLADQGINVVIRRNAEGRIYGITFIDHESRSVWNGSQLGKELSANVFNELWERKDKPLAEESNNKSTMLPEPSADHAVMREQVHNLLIFR